MDTLPFTAPLSSARFLSMLLKKFVDDDEGATEDFSARLLYCLWNGLKHIVEEEKIFPS